MAVTKKQKYAKAVGRRIRAIRKEKNISSKDFEVLEPSIDRHHLSKIESGLKLPSSYTIFVICQALNISQEKFFRDFDSELK